MPAFSLSSVGVMPVFSHTVKVDASPDFHSLPLTFARVPSHNVKVDKNAGPNHLREWREFRGMTLEQLADAVDTSPGMISMLESGDRGLSAKWLRRLAPALKTTPGHLLEHDPNSIATDVLDIWASIDVRDREQARRVLRSFVKTGTHD